EPAGQVVRRESGRTVVERALVERTHTGVPPRLGLLDVADHLPPTRRGGQQVERSVGKSFPHRVHELGVGEVDGSPSRRLTAAPPLPGDAWGLGARNLREPGRGDALDLLVLLVLLAFRRPLPNHR